ncbi:nucleotidylyl transferase superfamily protein [Striga asiatica]|uniref:Nucleotidylyl transferase superfamily protein n=1 Tax=Striga asiatica TaxID=4170 RepID=A0A5A7QX18_STRAF|nr:nucleotidylyl transferase superfamily protein [Striga asiatica]
MNWIDRTHTTHLGTGTLWQRGDVKPLNDLKGNSLRKYTQTWLSTSFENVSFSYPDTSSNFDSTWIHISINVPVLYLQGNVEDDSGPREMWKTYTMSLGWLRERMAHVLACMNQPDDVE